MADLICEKLIKVPVETPKEPLLDDDDTKKEEKLEEIKKRTLVAQIKCEDKIALQWIQIALEEAQSDLMEIGRPLTLDVHDRKCKSLLSKLFDASHNEKSKSVQLKGMVNLLMMLLIVTNVKNVMTSLKKRGFTLAQELEKLRDSS